MVWSELSMILPKPTFSEYAVASLMSDPRCPWCHSECLTISMPCYMWASYLELEGSFRMGGQNWTVGLKGNAVECILHVWQNNLDQRNWPHKHNKIPYQVYLTNKPWSVIELYFPSKHQRPHLAAKKFRTYWLIETLFSNLLVSWRNHF